MVGDELRELARLSQMREVSRPAPDWSAVTSTLGFDVPADYKQLIDRYGAGAFNDYVLIYGPGEDVQAFDLTVNGLYWDTYLKEEWADCAEAMPLPLRGRDITVLSWGATEDGLQLFWIAEPGTPPEHWPVVFYRVEGEAWEFYPRSTVEVLLALVRNELPTELLPPSWPPDEPFIYSGYP
jgi:hypothetical protein